MKRKPKSTAVKRIARKIKVQRQIKKVLVQFASELNRAVTELNMPVNEWPR